MFKAATPSTSASWIRIWLALLGIMVYAMVLVGGATRLTDSGLSITEWAPISGALPPLSELAWQAEFAKYQQTAEYQLQNRGMSLSEFQYIFWWEWGHRQLGRLIGLVSVTGLAIFASRRWLDRRWTLRFVALIALGGLQGAIGWWMVSSGIGETTRIDVAPYRLATHFTLALLIIGVIAWFWMDLGRRARQAVPGWQRWAALALLTGISLQMASGALVAGLDAGRSYVDWPKMGGEWVPQHYLEAGLGWRSLFEGRPATQFNHRIGAYLIWVGSLVFAWRVRGRALAGPAWLLAALVTAQALWGILTLINVAPLGLALVHQGLGVLVLLAGVRLAWRSSAQSSASSAGMITSGARVSAPASTNTT
ncbi:MAG: COX15/CtaA family protein [Hyphomonadaceae bacterium]|nr:COX15/CtaA family protein [Hyphomonadaceae bacterium]